MKIPSSKTYKFYETAVLLIQTRKINIENSRMTTLNIISLKNLLIQTLHKVSLQQYNILPKTDKL